MYTVTAVYKTVTLSVVQVAKPMRFKILMLMKLSILHGEANIIFIVLLYM